MKRLFSFSLLLVILVTSCKTSSDLASNALIQKRRYTKGFNLNVKKPVVNKTESVEQKISTEESDILAQANVDQAPAPIKVTDNELKSEEQNERELASMELSKSLIMKSEVKGQEDEVSSAAPTSIQDAYPLTLDNNYMPSGSNFTNTPAAPAASGEATLLIIILTILLPPLGVALVFGISTEFWLSLLLTLLFYFPGLIYSLIVIL